MTMLVTRPIADLTPLQKPAGVAQA
jgi:hypothetical protein